MYGSHTHGDPESQSARRAMVLDLWLEGYHRTYELQVTLQRLRQAGEIPDTLVLAEHFPCITLGRSAHREHLRADEAELARRGIVVYETDRGGDVTYHGLGQLVLYAIVDLASYGRDVHAHVYRLEQVLIDVLASFGVHAYRLEEYPGVWTMQGKIGAIGISAKRWVTLHGVALNVSPDMAHFSCIVPCGIADRPVVSLSRLLGKTVDMATVKSRARAAYERVFDVSLFDGDPSLYVTSVGRPHIDRRHEWPAPETKSAPPCMQPSQLL